MRRTLTILTLFLSISLSACSQHKDFDKMLKSMYKNTVPLIQPEELAQTMKQDTTIVLLDCREPKEYEVSHLANAQLAGYDHFDLSQVNHIPKDAPIVVYCSVGYRSERIGEQLQEAGYSNVSNLYGGIFQWVNTQNNVYNTKEQTTKQVHAYSKSWGKWLTEGEKIYD